jgi:hypothetical protein
MQPYPTVRCPYCGYEIIPHCTSCLYFRKGLNPYCKLQPDLILYEDTEACELYKNRNKYEDEPNMTGGWTIINGEKRFIPIGVRKPRYLCPKCHKWFTAKPETE